MIEEIFALITGIILIIIKYLLFKKKDEKAVSSIKAGKDIIAGDDIVIGDKITHNNYNTPKIKNNIETFEKYLSEKIDWERKIIDGDEEWIYIKDNAFKIKCEQQLKDFTEPWMKPFSFDINAKKGRKCIMSLLINGDKVHQVIFILIEPNKSFVPLPEREFDKEDNPKKYFWKKNSLEHKIYKIVKPSYDMSSLEEMAEKSELLEMR